MSKKDVVYLSNVCAERLEKLRSEKGLTQEQVAEAAGVSRVSYTRYENGTRVPKASPLLRLAELFDVDPSYIVGDTDNKKSGKDLKPEVVAEHDALFEQLTDEERRQAKQYMEFLIAQRKK